MRDDGHFVGIWSYRSFLNDPDLAAKFNELRFGAGRLTIEERSFGHMKGTLGGSGWSLGLRGWITYGDPSTIRFQGKGDIAGETWIYDYKGYLAPIWPNGVDQRPAILGGIVRTAPHSAGQATAGDVASWVAVRQG